MFKLIKRKINFSLNSLFEKNIILTPFRTFTDHNNLEKEKFWEEYTKTKRKGEKYPTFKSQSVRIYQTDNQWVFADRFCIKNTELLQIIQDIDVELNPPFLIIDVREESEFMIYKLPEKNKKGAKIPIIFRETREILTDYFDDFPVDKYLILIDSIGLRSRRVAGFLTNEGFKTLYVEGGYDMFKPIANNNL